jgi:AcrR family transcriptional regulator
MMFVMAVSDRDMGGPFRVPAGGMEGPGPAVVRDRRGHLLEAMASVCAERGYPGTEVSEVAARVGVSEAEFYEHFRDKEDCFLAAINAGLAELITAATSAYSADKPLVAVVRDAAAGILDVLAEAPEVAHIGFVDYRTATPAALETYESGTRVLSSLLDQLRVDSPSDATLPSAAARAALGGAEGVIRGEIAAGRATELRESLPAVLYGCLVPFLGQEEALRQAELVSG